MILKIKKVPMLKSALFLLLTYSLYSCHLEPPKPKDERKRNFKYRQQVLNQEHNTDDKDNEDELNPSPKQSVGEKEVLFGEIDPRFSKKTLQLSEQEIQRLNLLSFPNSAPPSIDGPKATTTQDKEPEENTPPAEEEPEEDTPPVEEESDKEVETPPTEDDSVNQSQPEEQPLQPPVEDSQTTSDDSDENPSNQEETQPSHTKPSKKPKTPPKNWNIDTIKVEEDS